LRSRQATLNVGKGFSTARWFSISPKLLAKKAQPFGCAFSES
jgi:hypothetical protein